MLQKKLCLPLVFSLTAICVTLTILNPDLPGINVCKYVCMNGCMQVVYVIEIYLFITKSPINNLEERGLPICPPE